MKLKIVRTVAPDVCYPDADTGRPDTDNRQATEPIRVLPVPVVLKPVDEHDLTYIRKVLTYGPSSKLEFLARLVGTSGVEATSMMIQRGDDYILKYYADKISAERQTVWVKKETERQASHRFWVFKNKVVEVDGWEVASREEIVTRVKHKVLSEEETFTKLKREIELFEKLERKPSVQREPISEDVRMFVWRRDGGRCVRCGSQERIEFDHIIPLEKGGSNTARNIQVLCERCNREKGTTV
jgi:hypothetical protein